jgi:hypothetical protein
MPGRDQTVELQDPGALGAQVSLIFIGLTVAGPPKPAQDHLENETRGIWVIVLGRGLLVTYGNPKPERSA